ncbi:MAG: 30S ribosomal protein S15 [Coriobacteriales bacterium]|jgi:small subunit ribosomal protein S15|nr:30S ribosomal protein S15 [Coriobacteriales bacterium]
MPLSKEKKAEIIKEYGKNETDSGSAEVQVALMSQRIKDLTEHLKVHPKDNHTRRGLLMLIGKRRRLLGYIKRRNIDDYRALIKKLGIRDTV